MWKSFTEGLAKRLGEHFAGLIGWAVALLGGTVLTWFAAPARYTLELTRLEIAGFVAVILIIIAVTAWAARHIAERRHLRRRSFAPIDELQESILRILWVKPDGMVPFAGIQRALGVDANQLRLACERLQERDFVMFNPYDAGAPVLLVKDGREYASAHGLTNANDIIGQVAARHR